MSLGEIVLRLKRTITEPFVTKAIINEKLPYSSEEILASANTLIGCYPVDPCKIEISDSYLKEIITNADNVCEGKIILFNNNIILDNPVNWFRDYAHNINCPKKNANRINYRKPELVGDVMFIWWLNRHQHLMPAAIAYFITGNQKYADVVINQLQSWLDDCPFPLGPAWLTGIEAGVRMITWSWIFRFLFAKGKPNNCSNDFLNKWFVSIRQHVRFIDTHWAKYSSANNHIIAEAVGVLAAVDTWPRLFPEKNYKEICRGILKNETHEQISIDGVDKEQSTSYHAFVLELLINASVYDNSLKKYLKKTIENMTRFLNALSGEKGFVPDIGDSDFAVASGLIPRSNSYYYYVAAAACSMERNSDIKHVPLISQPNEWYCRNKPVNKKHDKSVYFENGGYAVWKNVLPSGVKVNLCMLLSNLGYGQIAAHGHADALSFTLQINDEPVLIDPGTYAYHNQKKWRNYFKGTRAHNTLVINGLDQADIKGPFLWANKYYVHVDYVVMNKDQFIIKAEHDGYYRDEMVLTHRRELSWHPLLKKWILKDELIGNGNYDAELLFHVHPDRKVVREHSNTFRIIGTDYNLIIKFSAHFQCRVAHGEVNPPLGWFSPVLGEKIPSPTIVAKGNVIGFDNIFTEFVIEKTES